MKKLIIALMACMMTTMMNAEIKVLSIEPLKGTENQGFYHPKFSPKGDYLLFSTMSYKGLMMYDLATQEMKQLTGAENAGYETQISDGGKVVVYRDVEYVNNRRYTSIKRIVVETGDIQVVDEPSREKYAFDFSGGTIHIAKHKSIRSKRLVTDIRPVEANYVVAIEDMNLVLYTNNVRKVLNPQGKGSYVWPVISPDKKHIVYTVTQGDAFGTYVCDMQGENAVSLGYIGAPQWLGNEYIVGMLDLWDDGYKYTRSPIVTSKIDGTNRQVIEVPNHEVILYPTASVKGDMIAFETEGTVYVMKVEIQ